MVSEDTPVHAALHAGLLVLVMRKSVALTLALVPNLQSPNRAKKENCTK